MNVVSALSAVVLVFTMNGTLCSAQPAKSEATPSIPACPAQSEASVHTFYLHNSPLANDANEIFTGLRNMLPPDARAYLASGQNAILVCAQPEQIALVQRLITDLDRPKKAYRLTYTVSELDGSKRVSSQRFSMVLVSGQPSVLKQGSRIPVITGTYTPSSASQVAQVSYIDIGMNFDVSVVEVGSGLSVRTSVERSSLAEEKSGVGTQDPVVRQVSYKGASLLVPGKVVSLGTLDIPETTHHLEIAVEEEPLP